MKIVLFGATGPSGRALVSQALEQGHRVTAAVRTPEQAALPAGVIVVRADVMEASTLEPATRGQDVVISAIGTKPGWTKVRLFSEGTRNLLGAMRGAGVRRLICITGVGAGDSRGHGGFLYDRIFQPLLLKEMYLDKDRQEEILRGCDEDWTIVRPGRLTNGPRRGSFRALVNLDGVTVGSISRADVAAYILAHLEDAGTYRQAINLTY